MSTPRALSPAAPAAPAVFVDDLSVHGDAPAVLTAGGELTYRELDRRVADTAERLGSPRRLVAVEAANTVGALVAYLAALRGRHPVVLLPPGADGRARRVVEAYDPDVVMEAGSEWAVEARRPRSGHELHPDLALLLSTSGTTGTAKLVRLSRRNLQANADAIGAYLGLTPADRAPTTLPMPYCYGLSVINSYLSAGACLVLTDLSVVDRCFWDLFRMTGATSLAGVPYTFELLDRVGFDEMALPTLRYVTQAGGRLAPDQVRRYAALGERDGWEFFVMYGQTEATARMAYLPPALAGRYPEAIGIPVPGGAFRLEPFGDHGAGPDGGEVGELVYTGPNVMLGYAEGPADLALGRTVDELWTGDVARRNDAGFYEVIGRRSRFVKPFGLRVDLDELERLVSLAGVAGLCAGDDQRIVVAVQGRGHAAVIARLISDHCGLPASRVAVAEVDELPRLANGKPDYPAVSHLAPPPAPAHPEGGAGGDNREVGYTADDREAAIRSLYAEVIGRPVADDESFVAAGGDSLSYVELSLGLEHILGSLPADWHTRPLGDLLVTTPAPRRLISRVETSVVLRALSILLVVASHTGLWQVRGGAHILVGVAGFNFAQFRLGAVGGLWRSIARIAVPSMAWIGLAAAVGSQLQWRHVFLVNHLLGGADSRVAYWFIESIVTILAGLAAMLAIPAVRRHERRHPFGTALTVAVVGLAARLDLFGELASHHGTSQPETVLWLFALGWAGAVATTARQRLVVSLLLLPGLWGYWGAQPLREVIVGGGMLLLLWVPTLPIPRPLNRIVGAVAGMSLALYLTHWQVYPPLLRGFGSPAAFAGSLAVGLLAWLLCGRLARQLSMRRA
ncbi:MAG: AMP-binding protein [Actinomycetota bacterium]